VLASHPQVAQGKQRLHLRPVFRQAAVARFDMAVQRLISSSITMLMGVFPWECNT
jgi:hypothetical protein